MSKEKKKRKGHYGKVLGFCGVVACVALLLGIFGDGFGFGGGGNIFGGGSNGNGNGNNGVNGNGYVENNNETPSYQENGSENGENGNENGNGALEEPDLLIRVSGNNIYHSDREITIDELIPLLEELNQPDFVWELWDDHAIMETIQNVSALMRENGISFTER